MPKRASAPTLNDRVKLSSQRRRARESGSLRDEIFRVVAELLVANGYEAFSLRQVAEKIGYSATSIYRHFQNKDDLVFAVVDEAFRQFGRALEKAADGERDPYAALEAVGRAYIKFGLKHPVYYRLMFVQRPDYLLSVPPGSKEMRMASFGVVRRSVERAIAAGAVARTDANALSMVLWAQVHGIVSLAITMPMFTPKDVSKMAELHFAMLTDGLPAPSR